MSGIIFNPHEYADDNNVCVHCSTREDAAEFLTFLDENGFTWADGKPYTVTRTLWGYDKEDTVYYFNKGTHGSAAFARYYGRTVLEFDDLTLSSSYRELDIDSLY